MSAPRRPDDVELVRSAVKFLRHHDEADNGLGEVADLLEDIANGRWTLVDEEARRRFEELGRGVRAVTPQGPRATAKCADCGSERVVTPMWDHPGYVTCRDCHSITHDGEVVGRAAQGPRG